jgi:hypothetical protein
MACDGAPFRNQEVVGSSPTSSISESEEALDNPQEGLVDIGCLGAIKPLDLEQVGCPDGGQVERGTDVGSV